MKREAIAPLAGCAVVMMLAVAAAQTSGTGQPGTQKPAEQKPAGKPESNKPKPENQPGAVKNAEDLAASHAGHGLAIAALAWHSPSFLANVSGATLVLGGLGYAFIAAMAATSTDAAQRALGRAWGILHTVGIYYLWLVFVFTYVGPATRSPFHAVITLALTAAWALRLTARGRASRRYALP